MHVLIRSGRNSRSFEAWIIDHQTEEGNRHISTWNLQTSLEPDKINRKAIVCLKILRDFFLCVFEAISGMIVKNLEKQSLRRVRNIKFQGIKTIPCRVLCFMRVQGSSERGNLWKYLKVFFGRSRITGLGVMSQQVHKLTSYWRLMNHFVALALARTAACATNFSSRRAQTRFGCIEESSDWIQRTWRFIFWVLHRIFCLQSFLWKPLKSVWRRCMAWRCCGIRIFSVIFAFKLSP